MKKILFLVSLAFVSFSSTAANTAYMKCGPFTFSTSSSNDGYPRINGAKPDSQKVTFLKKEGDYDNIKMQWIVMNENSGQRYGLDYIKRNGRGILNAEAIRMNMNEPRVFGTYDCVKAK
ncbi:TPA: hypothetical protein OZU43_003399 [Escherichia coli]|uniref:hypothetical protein n=1 Tax=Enterobacteriaceae TaxID=543 RepID=UPI0006A6183E|nr:MULTISPECIES: hypothetical protein [Enterobacteriaceae]EEZ9019813.1 hypothetical protein [Escherichia coli]EFD0949283.1 hypothetical protein [Escherichia coli]EFH7034026.1 hypothetical protein [Escherichia coli]EFI5338184.1 hypothetical protein [Escherichia coli]EFK0764518.1 hypothetical protein [Escherichia coli]